jgi:cardiolipin synthase
MKSRKATRQTVDGIWATIGITNLDTRSFALNEELNAVLYDKDVAGELEKIFADDLTYSRNSTTRSDGAEVLQPTA